MLWYAGFVVIGDYVRYTIHILKAHTSTCIFVFVFSVNNVTSSSVAAALCRCGTVTATPNIRINKYAHIIKPPHKVSKYTGI